ncbi:helix-turn-helix domain-containing protein [uncultured Friedmanniella sp.]|uniref:AraC family transcriptional regulator n=1 Tax=uncultured Friedmanniella sp. TaxID=335381 RepID=UPI0035CCA83E
MLLAGEAGTGVVEVDGQRLRVKPGTIVVMPWGHAVRYEADVREPYLVYGAHLIPWHAADEPVDLAVPHHRSHPLTGVPSRADRPLAIGSGLWVGDARTRPALKSLVRLAAEVWDRGTPTLAAAQALGALLLDDLDHVPAVPAHDDRRLPTRLRRTLAWIHAEPGRPITLDQLATVAGASRATVNRLFRTHLNASPLEWVLQTRVEAAKVLLTTTSLSVAEVAGRCGFADAYYFSRQFHARTGSSPSAWRRQWSAP